MASTAGCFIGVLHAVRAPARQRPALLPSAYSRRWIQLDGVLYPMLEMMFTMMRPRYHWLVLFFYSARFGGCAAEVASRPPAADPTSAHAQESPLPQPPQINAADPLLSISAEPVPDVPGTHPDMPDMHHDMPGMHHDMPDTRSDSLPLPPTSPIYTCVMHPQVHDGRPGRCPQCRMPLVVQSGRGAQ